jgi:hypothetical protein
LDAEDNILQNFGFVQNSLDFGSLKINLKICWTVEKAATLIFKHALRACLKSLGPAQGDVGADEMKRIEMSFGLFLETYEYFPKPVEPGTGDFHDPTTRFIIRGMGHLFLPFLAPCDNIPPR